MSRKRACYEVCYPSNKVSRTEPETMEASVVFMTKAINDLTTVVRSLEETIKHQRYAIDSLKREVSDLQTHAMHGAFSIQGMQIQEDQLSQMSDYYRGYT